MPMKHKFLFPIIAFVVSLFIIFLENDHLYFGKFINAISPCKEDLRNSFPCYGIFDVGLMLVMLGVAISTLLIIFLRFIKYRRTGTSERE